MQNEHRGSASSSRGTALKVHRFGEHTTPSAPEHHDHAPAPVNFTDFRRWRYGTILCDELPMLVAFIASIIAVYSAASVTVPRRLRRRRRASGAPEVVVDAACRFLLRRRLGTGRGGEQTVLFLQMRSARLSSASSNSLVIVSARVGRPRYTARTRCSAGGSGRRVHAHRANSARRRSWARLRRRSRPPARPCAQLAADALLQPVVIPVELVAAVVAQCDRAGSSGYCWVIGSRNMPSTSRRNRRSVCRSQALVTSGVRADVRVPAPKGSGGTGGGTGGSRRWRAWRAPASR